jgi:hypothetical protein
MKCIDFALIDDRRVQVIQWQECEPSEFALVEELNALLRNM